MNARIVDIIVQNATKRLLKKAGVAQSRRLNIARIVVRRWFNKRKVRNKMGRLIDVDEVKKRLPIMENDWGMVINETLHKELDKVPTVEAISKADMVAILDEIRAEIEQLRLHKAQFLTNDNKVCIDSQEVLNIIDKYSVDIAFSTIKSLIKESEV